MSDPRDPIADLRRIAFLLERAQEATYRVQAFRKAAAALAKLDTDELVQRAFGGTLTELAGVGDVTARCVVESLDGEEPVYLRRLEAIEAEPLGEAAARIRSALRGTCHIPSTRADGGIAVTVTRVSSRSGSSAVTGKETRWPIPTFVHAGAKTSGT